MFAQAASGLAHLHTRRICHRDLHCKNILVDDVAQRRDGAADGCRIVKVVLCDFGQALRYTDAGADGSRSRARTMTCATAPLAYRAPELFLRQKQHGTTAVTGGKQSLLDRRGPAVNLVMCGHWVSAVYQRWLRILLRWRVPLLPFASWRSAGWAKSAPAAPQGILCQSPRHPPASPTSSADGKNDSRGWQLH